MSLKTYHIYSDESRHKTERFLLLAGLWIDADKITAVEEQLRAFRLKYGYTNSEGETVPFQGEMKWVKVSNKHLAIYKEFVDIFFEGIMADSFRFSTILVDTHDPAVRAYSNIKTEGYFKLLYQLYLHNSKQPGIYHIRPDRITNPKQAKVDLNTLHVYLERELKKKFIRLLNPAVFNEETEFVQSIIPTDSRQSNFIQMVDVVMGALGYLQNKHYEAEGASPVKVELMKYVFEKIALSGAIKISGKKYFIARSTKFNIWLFRPKTKTATER
jgi:hypothetical protein